MLQEFLYNFPGADYHTRTHSHSLAIFFELVAGTSFLNDQGATITYTHNTAGWRIHVNANKQR